MTLNKKHKKQIEVEKKKQLQLQQQLSGARKQMDDIQEVRRLEQDLAASEARMKKLQEG